MPEKPVRLAACDPCRQLKLACDHCKPVCSRCERAGRSNSCQYRERPFKKRPLQGRSQTQELTATQSFLENVTSPLRPQGSDDPVGHHYPNAGHLGLSSSATLFNRVAIEEALRQTGSSQPIPTPPISSPLNDKATTRQNQVLLEVLDIVNREGFLNLINFWLAKDIFLTLGGRFVESCTRSLQRLAEGRLFDISNTSMVSRKLSENTIRTLNIEPSSTVKDFSSEINDTNMGWEAISLALIAAGRATTDISFFPPLYKSRLELRTLQLDLTDLSDRCLDIMLGLDSLDVFQLICQYESFILHSVIDGDQSYSAWRRLGDVISSLLFLGLNERMVDEPMVPRFLTELRRTIFAQVYSDDKNEAVFLGRPPRLSRNFCCFQLPNGNEDKQLESPVLERPMIAPDYTYFHADDGFDQVTSLRWTTCCASLKEDILEGLQEHSGHSRDRAARFDAIYMRAQSLWNSLPDRLKLENTLSPHGARSPFENDLLLNMRLTYLQVIFLLKNGVANLQNESFVDADVELLQISQEMLSLVVEAIAVRDHLVNSGTSLLWKVAHYGLPAAGVICLSMLRPVFWQPPHGISIPKILQDLSILASDVRLGGLLQAEAPNYDLLNRAANTIQGLVFSAFSFGGSIGDLRGERRIAEGASERRGRSETGSSYFDLSAYSDHWGYEIDFWQDLGAHSSFVLPTEQL